MSSDELTRQAEAFLDLAANVRGALTPSGRCASILQHLESHYLSMHPGARKADFENLVALLEDEDLRAGGDQVLAGFIATSEDPFEEKLPPQLAAVHIALAYTVEALRADREGRRDEAWNLSFDAAQWEGFVSGVSTGGDPEQVRKAMGNLANQRSGGSLGGRKGAVTRAQSATDEEAVVQAAKRLGWPQVTKDVYKTVSQSFNVTPERIGQILRARQKTK